MNNKLDPWSRRCNNPGTNHFDVFQTAVIRQIKT